MGIKGKRGMISNGEFDKAVNGYVYFSQNVAEDWSSEQTARVT
jgi:hypothetical protein